MRFICVRQKRRTGCGHHPLVKVEELFLNTTSPQEKLTFSSSFSAQIPSIHLRIPLALLPKKDDEKISLFSSWGAFLSICRGCSFPVTFLRQERGTQWLDEEAKSCHFQRK
jgi:hypothetical protein